MKVAIIGAGIYGCHIGKILLERGINISIFEKSSSLFDGASGKNQFRLHLGFHYARDFNTRQQSKLGFTKFLAHYEKFTKSIDNNLYVIPNNESLIDFKTYLAIFEHENFPFDLYDPLEINFLNNTEGIISVGERIINVSKLKEYFQDTLINFVEFNFEVTKTVLLKLSSDYDFVIDCTWGKLLPPENIFYEVTHLAYYKLKNNKKFNFGITYVDGSLCSLYPTEQEKIYTLSSVEYTPLFKSDNLAKANDFLDNISDEKLDNNAINMEYQLKKFFPSFCEYFELEGHQVSMKSKINGCNDPRDCRITQEGNIISIFSGKIDTLYIAEDYILNKLL